MDKLIIVPGLSSPNSKKHRPVYECLLEQASGRLPAAKSEVLLLPGQADPQGNITGEFSIPDAAGFLKKRIQECTEGAVMLLARSSGCDVVAEALRNSETRKRVSRIVLWGPPPFWLYYDMFTVEGLHTKPLPQRKDEDGLYPSSRIVPTAFPFETRLTELDDRTLIASGGKDEYSPPEYHKYLAWLCRKMNDKPKFEEVPDCPHSVTPQCQGWGKYCDVLFGWLNGKGTNG
jgi:hypothetical protein